jgi:DNA-binding response OmpR family regulator
MVHWTHGHGECGFGRETLRVLIVEDDKELADILRRAFLEKLYNVEIARDGESARHFALSEDFDLIVLDIMIPRIDGIGVCHAIRGAGKLTPVIMLTARDRVDDRVLGLDAGADDYLIKPFSMSELFARIRAVQRRGAHRSAGVLRVGDLTLDPRASHVDLRNRKIPLTAKEFALLQFFMQHPDAILSRTEILENVWDSNYDGFGNVVEVYVNYLRRKLEEGGEPRRIETVWGRGYVLKSNPQG